MEEVKAEEEAEHIEIERGDVSEAQVAEIEKGEFYTVREIADELRYTYSWIIQLCQTGRINAIKPMSGRWRIPASERRRLLTEGIPPPTTKVEEEEEVEAEPITVIEVAEESVAQVKEEPPEVIAKKPKGFLDFLFKD